MNVEEFQRESWDRTPFHTNTCMTWAGYLWEGCSRDIATEVGFPLVDYSLLAV
jgi:hypothetical protein